MLKPLLHGGSQRNLEIKYKFQIIRFLELATKPWLGFVANLFQPHSIYNQSKHQVIITNL